MRCQRGFCIVCDKAIVREDGSPTNEYTYIEVEWSNKSRMQVAMCVGCATSHKWATPEAKAEMTKAHFRAWDKEGGSYDPEAVIV